ncbi:hypothetical protein PAMA_014130 [Pampus argenteus]
MITAAAAAAAAAGEQRSAEKPLVVVSFLKNDQRKKKYLEAEPKALGLTQIGLSVFQIVCVSVFLSKGLNDGGDDIVVLIASPLVVIAGSLAIAAQNLHLPTLRGCLVMQILACGASIFNIIFTFEKMDNVPPKCWRYYYDNANSSHHEATCHIIESTQAHFYAEFTVIHAALLAISATLATYCCKVVNCCSPAAKIPVITVHSPPVTSGETN